MDFGILYENDKGEYVALNDVRMADIRLASLVYVSTYCVPIVHLRQNKPFPLLFLGHAQIKSLITSLHDRAIKDTSVTSRLPVRCSTN